MLKRILLVVVAFTLLSGCEFSSLDQQKTRMGAAMDIYKGATLTDEEVAELGRQAAESMDKKNTVAPAGSKYAKRLDKITKGLNGEYGLELNFKVYVTKNVNAFALPDGSIRVYSGLMDVMSDDQLFFVIGHEIGHVKNGDSKDRFRLAYATSAGKKLAESETDPGVSTALTQTQILDLVEAFIHAQFSQSQELAADQNGLELLQNYGKNEQAGVDALMVLAGLSKKDSSVFSSHPDSQARAEKIQAAIEGK